VLFFTLIDKWEFLAYRKLEYKRKFDKERVFPMESLSLTIEATNKKLLPLTWLEIESDIPNEMMIEKERISKSRSSGYSVHNTVLSLLWFQRIRRRYSVCFTKRGYYQLRDTNIKKMAIKNLLFIIVLPSKKAQLS